MKGEDVFAFTMDVVPRLIADTLSAAGWTPNDVELFSLHQANKQILEMLIAKAGIPAEKTPTDVFSKYANNSTNSVVTVVCDQVGKPLGKTVLAAFGIGLSWGGAALDLSGTHNGGITTYHPPAGRPTREQQIEHWLKYFTGE
jgi:3-oxoacyl-[acyl-carrier-protein] synthase-3